ncbi:MAG: macro domain-containing protein [Thermoprotei archaeon]|nr:MAG: macro domain-containing protein [Thermoprotei archaeon]
MQLCRHEYKNVNIEVVIEDITKLEIESIVNPANSLMIMGGGVARAIKRAGGEEIEKEAMEQAPVPIGEAIVTKAGRLRVKYVIHAPTMEGPAMRTNTDKVRVATKAALRKANECGISEVAFPGMGTGIGGLDPEIAADTMVLAIKEHIDSGTNVRRIILVALQKDLGTAFCKAIERILTMT